MRAVLPRQASEVLQASFLDPFRSQAKVTSRKAFKRMCSSAASGIVASRLATYRAGLSQVSGGRRSVSKKVCSHSSVKSFSTFSGVADGVASDNRAASSSYEIGVRAAVTSRASTRRSPAMRPAGRTAFAGGGALGKSDAAARDDGERIRAPVKLLEDRRLGFRRHHQIHQPGHIGDVSSWLSTTLIGSPGPKRRPTAALSATPANSPYGVGRVDILIQVPQELRCSICSTSPRGQSRPLELRSIVLKQGWPANGQGGGLAGPSGAGDRVLSIGQRARVPSPLWHQRSTLHCMTKSRGRANVFTVDVRDLQARRR